jgi:DNA polymerase I-like protein with 3'-5' exonuclease and polymerase domains
VRFDDPGMFWLPEVYRKETRVGAHEKAPRVLPPIPETGWTAREHFPDLSAARVIGIDTETCDPDLLDKGPGCRRGAYIVGVSVAADDFAAYYPIAHSIGKNLDSAPVFAWLRRELARPAQPKVGANVLYDLDFLAVVGVEVRGPLYDVQYADPLLDEYAASYSLESIAERRIGEHKETSALYQWCASAYGGNATPEQRRNIWRAPAELVGPYAEQDALLPVRILRAQWKLLQEKGLLDIFRMECKLIPLLLRLRQQGVKLDLARVQRVDDELNASIDTLRAEVGVNVFAAAELEALCDKEGIAYPRTAQGNPSFVRKWLLAHPHPTLRKVSQLRQFYKLRDTFIRGALLGTHIGGAIHCEFNPLRSDEYGTVSGRYSSSHPNLQQIPKRDKYWGPRLRACFIPHDADLVWMRNDLSQIEFRLGVHYGTGEGIEAVRDAYRNDSRTDFYSLAATLTGLDRDASKAISLGTLYGMGERKFAALTERPLEEAFQLFAQFNDRLPFMRHTYDTYGKEALENGYVRTIGGRICNLDADHAHKALNRKLQGSCADWIKLSMLRAYAAGLFDVLTLYLTVHDELDCGVPRTPEGLDAARELHHIMTHAYELTIPVLAGIDLGANWGELNECTDLNLAALTAAPTGE